MIGCAKKNWENHPWKCFWPTVNLRLVLIDLRITGPWEVINSISRPLLALAFFLRSVTDISESCILYLRCMAGLSFIVNWTDIKDKFALYSLSRTRLLGNTVLRARHKKESPVESILQHENGKLLITGKVWQMSLSVILFKDSFVVLLKQDCVAFTGQLIR